MDDVRELEHTRLAQILRRWPRYGWDYLGRSRWESWTAEPFLGLGIVGALIATLYFEFTLLTGKAEPWFAELSDLGLHPKGQAVILLLTGINAWTMDRWIASRTRGDRFMSAWLRLLRPLTAGVPVLGLASVPAWRWIAESRPAWAFHRALPRAICSPTVPEPSLWIWRFSRAEVWVRTHSQNMPELMAWIVGCQLAPFVGGLSWLAGNGPLDVSRRTTLQAACVVLHLLAALFGVWYSKSAKLPSRALPWLLLTPGLGILSILLVNPRSGPTQEQKLLVVTVFEHRQIRTLPSRPLLGIPRSAGVAEAHQLAFFRLKTLLLGIDAAALAWLAGTMIGWRLGSDLPTSPDKVVILLLPALPGALLTTVCLVAEFIGRGAALREMGRRWYGPFLFLVPTVLSSGLFIGSLQARGSTLEVGRCLYLFAISAVLLQILWMPISALAYHPAQAERGGLLWYLLWAGLIVLSGVPATPRARTLEMAFILAPLWSLGSFLALGSWLLRPFTFRHLADRRLPGRDRAILAGVALTAAVPLGGLFIPFWIYAHHRLWPGMERSWAAARP